MSRLFALITVLAAPASAVDFDHEVGMRWRWHEVRDDIRGDAFAHTLKASLTGHWSWGRSWQVTAEWEGVAALKDDYNSVTVTRPTSPIPDPRGSELNRLFVHYDSLGNWSLDLGRQRLAFDDERHVSPVSIWQNEQTFDGATFTYQDNLHWSFKYSHLRAVNRIFGADAKAIVSTEDIRYSENPVRPVTELGRHRHNSHLLHLSYRPGAGPVISSFFYSLDNRDASIFATDTLGIRLSNTFKPGRFRYEYTLELAQQWDAADNPWQYRTSAYLAEFSLQYFSHQFSVGQDRRGQDNGFTFQTSLGDNHRYLGWADLFSGYSMPTGIRDTFLGYRGRSGKLRWRMLAHEFRESGNRVGHELDIELAYRFDRRWEGKLVVAGYRADQGYPGLLHTQENLGSWFLSLAYNL